MIRLFISDIDGCIAEPYSAYRLEHVAWLAQQVHDRRQHGERKPMLSLCSGRAYPYVEALTQALGLDVPVLFESGGGMFHLPTARISWHPGFTDDVAAQLDDVRRWLQAEIVPGTSLSYDFGKRTQAGVIGPEPEDVIWALPTVEARIEDDYPDLVVNHTPVSIDVLARTITKREALEWLAEETGVELAQAAYIGDANGDIPALQVVGHSFAPANATEEVRRVVDHALDSAVSEAVLEAYRWCVAQNERRLAA